MTNEEIAFEKAAKIHRAEIRKLNWLNSLGYIPEFMRDFHEAKDVFKKIEEDIQQEYSKPDIARDIIKKNMPSTTTAHIYTIDHFLYVMAKEYGYTLQKTRKKFDEDLNDK